MNPRTLVFVDHAADAGPPDPATDVVVLDTAWTPGPGDRADLISIRPALTTVLRRVDLFDGSLERLDAWAASGGLADRFTADGVTWWYRIRMIVRWDLHELMLWRHLLDELAPSGRYALIVVPGRRASLAAAARAAGPSVGPEVRTVGDARISSLVTRGRHIAIRVAGPRGREILRSGRDALRWRPKVRRRERILRERAAGLAAEPHGVLAIASAGFFQIVSSGGRERLVDPHLALVLDQLAGQGRSVVTLALKLDHRLDSDWAEIARDDRLLPHSMLSQPWSDPEADRLDKSDIETRVEGLTRVPLEVGGWDLGPAFGSIVAGYAGAWLLGQRRGMRRAERLMNELRPSVLFIDHEGVRTMWLAAARRSGIPIVAVQHGMIYANNPEYCHPLHHALVRPDVTCVFGPFERDILVGLGGYEPTTVIVTGSSRADPEATDETVDPDERANVRNRLRVADGDRLLVVSAAHNPVGGDLHTADMVARMLGGPLTGIHIVFKLHPQDLTQGPFERLLHGLARAGGYPAPPMTSVRNFDLYPLLRAADAHLGQYSTVLTDAVVAGTPNMIAVGLAYGDVLGYVSAGVAVPVTGIDDVRSFMLDPRPPTPDDRARFLDAHFARGNATTRIIETIVATEARYGSGAAP